MENDGRIQQKANDLFRRYGVKSITMDEITNQLGVSKKRSTSISPIKINWMQLSGTLSPMPKACAIKTATPAEMLHS